MLHSEDADTSPLLSQRSSVYNSSEIVAVVLNISLLLVNKIASKHSQLYIVHVRLF